MGLGTSLDILEGYGQNGLCSKENHGKTPEPTSWVVNLEEDSREDKGFPGGAVVENLPANAGDTGSSPGLGGSHMPRSS